jgi:aminobenzoyl-glutamate utilization protein B
MKTLLALFLLLIVGHGYAQLKIKGEKDKQFLSAQIDKRFKESSSIAKEIWSWAELGYLETRSSTLLQETLKREGFNIENGVAEMPTAFVATFGSGSPTIGILAEFDALPGLSQDSVPFKKPFKDGVPGHGCGHNLFGTASIGSAIAIKDWLLKNKRQGTVKVFGTPAEESGGGKVYMVRAGLFDNVDAVLHWHPADHNQANAETCLAFKQAKFRFYGMAAHAAAAPHLGRSALDAVEVMNYMTNLMREHVPQETRIHYVITKGGLAANIVPDFAEVEYIIRHPDARVVQQIWDRIVKCAEGATLGTETTMKYEVLTGHYSLLPISTLSRVMYDNLKLVGGVKYDEREKEFAKKLQSTFSFKTPDVSQAELIEPYTDKGFFPASTDVGDISWITPTVGLGTATWVPGTPAHSWQSTCTGGMSIGFKAMQNASKTIAYSAIDIFNNPELIAKAKAELENARGKDFKYTPMVGDRKPPLDYRKALEK